MSKDLDNVCMKMAILESNMEKIYFNLEHVRIQVTNLKKQLTTINEAQNDS